MMQAPSKKQRVQYSRVDVLNGSDALNPNRGIQKLENEKKPVKRKNLSFDDEKTSDVVVRVVVEDGDEQGCSSEPNELEVKVLLHKEVLVQCRYFAALLSDRWQEKVLSDKASDEQCPLVDHSVLVIFAPSIETLGTYISTLQLLYTKDFAGVIVDVQMALSILPIAAELLFDECVQACVQFLEAVPWNKDEETQIKELVFLLQLEESEDLLARLYPVKESASEDMLHELVYAATHSHQNAASVKAFVAKILSSFHSKETVRLVLDKAFANSLKIVKDSVEEYTSPNLRGRHDEIEAIQRQNLHTAVVSGRHLLWLVERMIELRVAETAVLEWSKQRAFTANLKRALSDDIWRNTVPGLPVVLLRCTSRLLNGMVAGTILMSRDVRKKLVGNWLPVLVTSRENVNNSCNKQLHQELEVAFLQLIMTLPVTDAQEFLQQCLTFATRSVDDCPHLVSAFTTWFQRAGQASLISLGKPDGESNS